MSHPNDPGPRRGGTLVRGTRPPEPTIPEPAPPNTRRPVSYQPATTPGARVSLPGSRPQVGHGAIPARPPVAAPPVRGHSHDAELMPGVGHTVYEFQGDAAASGGPGHGRGGPGVARADTFYNEASFSAEPDARGTSNLRGSRMTWVIVALIVVVAGGLAVGMSKFAPGPATASDSSPPAAASDGLSPATPAAATPAATTPAAVSPTGPAVDGSNPPVGATPAGSPPPAPNTPPAATTPPASTPAATQPSTGKSAADEQAAAKPDPEPAKTKPKAESKPRPKKKAEDKSSGIKPKKPPRKDLDDLPPPPDGG